MEKNNIPRSIKKYLAIFYDLIFFIFFIFLCDSSFKDIVSVTNHKKKILNESEIEKLILEIDNSSDEIKELFNDLLTVDIKLFKSIRVKFKNGVLISGNIYFYIFKIKLIPLQSK